MTAHAPRRPRAVRRIARLLPEGGALPDPAFWARHRAICAILALHGLALALIAPAQGRHVALAPAVAATPVACALVAMAMTRLSGARRSVASCTAATGLLVSSAELVALFDGLTEMHFHFSVTLAIVALQQDWAPYLIAVGFVLVEYGSSGRSPRRRSSGTARTVTPPGGGPSSTPASSPPPASPRWPAGASRRRRAAWPTPIPSPAW